MPRRWSKRTIWIVLAVWSALAFSVVGGVLAVGAAAFSSTELELQDFESNAQARQFVAEHLPLPLPETVTVLELRYESWAEWRLSTVISFAEEGGLEGYWEKLSALPLRQAEWCPQGGLVEGPLRFTLEGSSGCCSLAKDTARLSLACYTL